MSDSDSTTKIPCKYCGAKILPATAQRTGGFCMPCSNNPVWKHGFFYHAPNLETIHPGEDAATEPQRVPCLYCGRLMLRDTAKRTGGFCMPHSQHNTSFLATLGGTPRFDDPLPQEQVLDALISRDTRHALSILFSIMQPGDTLHLFSAEPQGTAPFFAARGVALFRDSQCITGFVAEWSDNPAYGSDREEPAEEAEIAAAFGDEWPAIKQALPDGAEFVRFSTSQHTWDHLCGRAGYAIKVNGEYQWHVITTLN